VVQALLLVVNNHTSTCKFNLEGRPAAAAAAAEDEPNRWLHLEAPIIIDLAKAQMLAAGLNNINLENVIMEAITMKNWSVPVKREVLSDQSIKNYLKSCMYVACGQSSTITSCWLNTKLCCVLVCNIYCSKD